MKIEKKHSCILFIHVLVSFNFLRIYEMQVNEFRKPVSDLPAACPASCQLACNLAACSSGICNRAALQLAAMQRAACNLQFATCRRGGGIGRRPEHSGECDWFVHACEDTRRLGLEAHKLVHGFCSSSQNCEYTMAKATSVHLPVCLRVKNEPWGSLPRGEGALKLPPIP